MNVTEEHVEKYIRITREEKGIELDYQTAYRELMGLVCLVHEVHQSLKRQGWPDLSS